MMCIVTTFSVATGRTSLTPEVRLWTSTTLPGVPIAVEVLVTNATPAEEGFSNAVEVTFSRDSGAKTTMLWSGGRPYGSLPNPALQGRLRPSESRRIYFPVTPFAGLDPWMTDGRMLLPGKYEFEITIHGVPAARGEYTVTAPTGVDAEVWSFMQSLAGEHEFAAEDWIQYGPQIADFISHGRSSSGYAPYAAVFSTTPSSDLTKLTVDGLDPATKGEILFRKAVLYLARATALAGKLEFEQAAAQSDSARAALDDISRTSPAYLQEEGAVLRKKALTRKQYEDSFQFRQQYAPAGD
jgi:hypothetical protein